MKTLILMRHAKSDWGTSAASDHERPLNARGRTAAAALGDWLRSNGLQPHEVLCSTALRTRQTLEGLNLRAPTRFLGALYHAEAAEMLVALRTAKGDCVLMVGHNPGIAEFAGRLVADPPDHARFDDYPTGATLVARFEISDWRDAGWEAATVADFTVPRDLA